MTFSKAQLILGTFIIFIVGTGFGYGLKSFCEDNTTNSAAVTDSSDQYHAQTIKKVFLEQDEEIETVQNGAATITGTIKLSESVRGKYKASAADVIFIIARPKGQKAGPPLAVKKITGLQLLKNPAAFSIGPENVMMGEASAFSGALSLSAKLSKSGDAITQAGDFIGKSVDSVAVGSEKVELTLDSISQ